MTSSKAIPVMGLLQHLPFSTKGRSVEEASRTKVLPAVQVLTAPVQTDLSPGKSKKSKGPQASGTTMKREVVRTLGLKAEFCPFWEKGKSLRLAMSLVSSHLLLTSPSLN
jgi:hypothetical protein